MPEGRPPWKTVGLTRDVLERMYWDDGLSYAEIGQRFGCKLGNIYYHAKKWNIPVRHGSAALTPNAISIRRAPRKLINKAVTPELAHLLGIFWGDGTTFISNVYGYRVFCGLSENFADKSVALFKSIGANAHKSLISRGKWQPNWLAQGASKDFVCWVRSLGIDDLKVMFAPPTLVQAFWQGMFEADGSLVRHKDRPDSWQFKVSNTNQELMAWGFEAFRQLGYDPYCEYVHYHDRPKWKDLVSLKLGKKDQIKSFLSVAGDYPLVKGAEFMDRRDA